MNVEEEAPRRDWLITVEITATRSEAFAFADHVSASAHQYDNASVSVEPAHGGESWT